MRLLLVVVPLLLTLPAHAATWWVVHADGNKPSRHAVFIDIDKLQPRAGANDVTATPAHPTLWKLDAVEVFESSDSPKQIAGNYIVDCSAKTIATEAETVTWRSGKTDSRPAKVPWPIGPGSIHDDMRVFACEPASRIESRGMRLVGSEKPPTELAWAALWGDGAAPAAPAVASAEAKPAAPASAQTAADKEKEKEKAWKAEADRRKQQRARTEINDRLDAMIGQDEPALVRALGIPTRNYESNGARFLNFREDLDRPHIGETTQPAPLNSRYCDLLFELRDGKVLDFKADGNYCNTMLGRYGR